MSDILNWNHLADGRCPKCGELLRMGSGNPPETIHCTDSFECKFKIRVYKFKDIVERSVGELGYTRALNLLET